MAVAPTGTSTDEIANFRFQTPHGALAGGPDGLDVIRRILEGAKPYLLPGGWLLIEIDYRQADHLLQEAGPALLGTKGKAIPDLSGRNRVVAWRIESQAN